MSTLRLVQLNSDYLVRLVAREGLLGPWEPAPAAVASQHAEDVVRAWVRRWLIPPHRPGQEHLLFRGDIDNLRGQIAVLLAETIDPRDQWLTASGMDSDGFWGTLTQEEAMASAPARAQMDHPAVDVEPDPAFIEAVLAYQRGMR